MNGFGNAIGGPAGIAAPPGIVTHPFENNENNADSLPNTLSYIPNNITESTISNNEWEEDNNGEMNYEEAEEMFGKRPRNNNNNIQPNAKKIKTRKQNNVMGGRRKHSHTKKCKCPRKRTMKRRQLKRRTHRAPRK